MISEIPSAAEAVRPLRAAAVGIVVGATAAAAILLAAVQMLTVGRSVPIPDALTYLDVADQIQQVGYGAALPLHWAPLYPLYVLALRKVAGGIVGDELMLTAAGDAFLLILACVVVAVGLASIARRCWPDGPRLRAAWVAYGASAALFLCFGVLRVGLRMPDALVTAIAFATLVVWVHAVDRRLSPPLAAIAGLLSGAAFLARSNLLHWSIGVAFVAMVIPSAARPRRRLVAGAAFLAGLMLIAVPHVISLSRARGTFVYGESGKIVFAETYGARWPVGGHRWPVVAAAGDLQVYPDSHDVSFPGFYDPGREYEDAAIPFSSRNALRGFARAVQSMLLGYWTTSFAIMWPLLWALSPLAIFGPAAWQLRRAARDREDRAVARARMAWLLILAGGGGLAMHLASVSIGYYLPPYVLALVVGAAMLLLNTEEDRTARLRCRALYVVAIGFVLAVGAVTASQFRWAAGRQRLTDRLDSRAIASALSSLPHPGAGRRRVAVVGEWLGLYGVRTSDSQVVAAVTDERALADSARRDRLFAALREWGIVAVLARRESLPVNSAPGWAALPATTWVLLDLRNVPQGAR